MRGNKQVIAEYRKQRRRIQSFLRRAEKRDFLVPENILPKIPKNITSSSVRRLQKLTADALYRKLEYLDKETGEIQSGRRGLKTRREKAKSKRAETPSRITITDIAQIPTSSPTSNQKEYDILLPDAFSRTIIENWKSYVLGFPKGISDKLMSWMNTIIKEQGEPAAAQMLEDSPAELRDYLQNRSYDSDTNIQEYCADMLNYLPEASEQYKHDLMEAFENDELGYEIE